jgi:hypothetical protein
MRAWDGSSYLTDALWILHLHTTPQKDRAANQRAVALHQLQPNKGIAARPTQHRLLGDLHRASRGQQSHANSGCRGMRALDIILERNSS